MSGWKYCHPLPPDPSLTDGVDSKKVDRYRRDGPEFIRNIAVELNLHSNVYNTGIVFYHRFYQRHSFNKYKRWYLAAACLFVAGKVEEQPKKLKDLLPWVYKYYPRKPGEPPRRSAELGQKLFQEMKAQVLANECALLKTLQFDFVVRHPPEYLFRFAKALRLSTGERIPNELVQLAFKYITDSFKTTLCMEYPPDAIAVSFLYLASRKQKVEVFARLDPGARRSSVSSKVKPDAQWWETFVPGSSAHMQDICDRIVQFYERSNASTMAVTVDPSEIGTPGTPSTPLFERVITPVHVTSATLLSQNGSSMLNPSPVTTPSAIVRISSNTAPSSAGNSNHSVNVSTPSFPINGGDALPSSVAAPPLPPTQTLVFHPSSYPAHGPPEGCYPPHQPQPPHQMLSQHQPLPQHQLLHRSRPPLPLPHQPLPPSHQPLPPSHQPLPSSHQPLPSSHQPLPPPHQLPVQPHAYATVAQTHGFPPPMPPLNRGTGPIVGTPSHMTRARHHPYS